MITKRDAAIARSKVWYAANKERAKTANAAWYAANKAQVKANAATNKLHIQAVKAEWYARNKQQVKERNAAWRAANVDIESVRARNYRATYPARYAANKIVMQAVASGRLVPLPCWVCGAEKTEAHHANYDAPLDVVWLCRKHHRQLHTAIK